MERMESVSLYDLRQVAIIIPAETGKEYYNQVGCVCCLQMATEGYLEILPDVPLGWFDCDTGEVARLNMKLELEKHGGIFERVVSVEGSTEAWLDVTFVLSREYLEKHPQLDIRPGQEVSGTLTYENCD